MQDLFVSLMVHHDRLYLNDGAGELLEVTDRTPGSVTANTKNENIVCAADFDGDGNVDLLRTGAHAVFNYWFGNGHVWEPYVMFWGDGKGGFMREELTDFDEHHDIGFGMIKVCEDLNGDGTVDFMTAHWDTRNFGCHLKNVVYPAYGIDNQMFFNDGTGRFTEVTVGPAVSSGGSTFDIISADFNNDQREFARPMISWTAVRV